MPGRVRPFVNSSALGPGVRGTATSPLSFNKEVSNPLKFTPPGVPGTGLPVNATVLMLTSAFTGPKMVENTMALITAA